MKRSLDIVLSVFLLAALLPLLFILSVLVRINLGSPILFRQQRAGLFARPFTMLKFRTMGTARDKDGNLLSDAERMTQFGRFLRSTSLDELPELINVLKGEMSLVGPRPLLLEYLPLYSAEQQRRHDVRPGITGWAQVHGRNALRWEEKLRLDTWYVDNHSLWLDLKITLMTIGQVVSCRGIRQEGHVTSEPFRGTVPLALEKAQPEGRR